jgi:hypothetical protein
MGFILAEKISRRSPLKKKQIGGPGEDSNLHLRILPAVFLGYITGPSVSETHCGKQTFL